MTVRNLIPTPMGADAPAITATPNQEALIERFEQWSATYFLALFAGRLFDQILLPEVAAGVEWTGRIRYSPFARAGRSAASDQLAMWGDEDTRQREFDRLKVLHRDVHGASPEGVRFSALSPEAWNWILISTVLMYLNSYSAVAKEQLGDEDRQALWGHMLRRFDGLQLSDRNRLPRQYVDAVEYYQETVATKAECTEIFAHVTDHLRRPPAPEGTPLVLRPAFALLGRALIRPVAILSIGITDPAVRTLAGQRWTRMHQAEFNLYTSAVRVAHQRLPRRLVYTPLAYNRNRYQDIVGRYQGAGLDAFGPSSDRGCPMGR